MGGFLLIKDETAIDPLLIKDSMNVFEKKNLSLNKKITFSNYSLYVYFKRSHQFKNVLYINNQDFIISVGTFIYNSKIGVGAQRDFFTDFDQGRIDFAKIVGHYCIIIFAKEKLYLFNDYEGIYHVYCNKSKSVISNSFLALSKLIPRRTLSHQEIYEYILYGTTYGEKTIFEEIEMLNCTKIYKIDSKLEVIDKKNKISNDNLPHNFEFCVKKVTENILDYFHSIKDIFDDDVIMGLSGGFDSRLLLASLLTCDCRPKVYVSGEEHSRDYQISKMISQEENLDFTNYRESSQNELNPEDYKTLISRKCYNLDGMGYAGIFNTTLDMDVSNSSKAGLNLNGGAGEIYRNLWFFKDKSLSVKNFLKSIYYNTDLNFFTDQFNGFEFFDNFGEKISAVLNEKEKKISKDELQLLYPVFELKYYAGNDISTLNQSSYALLPFSETRFTVESGQIPLKYKTAGVFEAALIKKIHPKIAKYPSVYGYNFYDDIKLKNKMYDIAIINTPYFFRPFLRRIKSRKKTSKRPYFLGEQYLNNIFRHSKYEIDRFVNVSSINNIEILSRVLTLEYLLTKVY